MRKFRQFRQARRIAAQATAGGGVRISELPAATLTDDADQFEVNQAGTSRRLTLDQIVAAVPPVVIPPTVVNRVATVNYYVATTGSDASDGLSAASPVLTLRKALDLCQAAVASSSGLFIINVAAGTYTQATLLNFTTWLFVGSPLTIKGPVVAAGVQPAVIIQGSTDGTRTHDFMNITGGGVSVSLENIFFQSFSPVISITQFARGSLVNCWTRNCGNVMNNGYSGYAGAFGGDWDGRDLANVPIPGATGLSVVIASAFNADQSSSYTGLLIHHWDRAGVAISESSSGHMRFLRIEDCVVAGVELIRNTGGPNMSGIRIWRCATGILATGGVSALFIGDDADFGQGTANACGTNVVHSASPAMQQQMATGYDTRVEYCVATRLDGPVMTGLTVERDMWSPVADIVRGRAREGDSFNIHLHSSSTLSTDGTLRLYFGSTLAAAWTLPASTAGSKTEIVLAALNGTDWRGQIYQLAGTASSFQQIATTAGLTSLSADTTVRLTWQAGAALDSLQTHIARLYSSIAGLRYQPLIAPPDLGASLLAWWDAEQFSTITQAGGLVSSWRDIVGGYDVTATGAAQPSYDAASFGDRPGISFDGVANNLTLLSPAWAPAGSAGSEDWYAFDQAAPPADTTPRSLGSWGSGSASNSRVVNRVVVSGVNRANVSTGNGTAGPGNSNTLANFSGRVVVRSVVTPTQSFIEVNGLSSAPSSIVPATAAGRLRMAANSISTAGSFAQGTMNTRVITGPLTTDQANGLRAWLTARI